MAKKKEKEKKKKKKSSAPEGEAQQAAPKAKKGSILMTLLTVLLVFLSVVEVGLLSFIGFRYFQSHILHQTADAGVEDGVGIEVNAPQADSRVSYIGPGLYIKDNSVVYDYYGITGQVKGIDAA